MRAATLFDKGEDCGVKADAAMLTRDNTVDAQEYRVERYLRENLILPTAPVSLQTILNLPPENVLGLPKSH